jgi:lipopolysaccharide export system protein LptA
VNHKHFLLAIIISGLASSGNVLFGQIRTEAPKSTTTTPGDTVRVVEILPGAKKLEIRRINDSTTLQILSGGDVRLKQGNTLFYCDSCVINNNQHVFEAFGHVHINDSDTSHAYGDYLKYLTDKKVAYLNGNAKLTDGKTTLTTPDLEYNLDTKIGIYSHGGKVVNKKSVLTSQEGYYYTDLKDIYFKKNVVLDDPAYKLRSDSLLYNTNTQTTRFIAETHIVDSSGRTIVTRDGYYDLKQGKAEFGQRPVIVDGKTKITADRIAIDDSTGVSQAEGNAVIIDTAQGTTIVAGQIFRNNKKEAVLATKKPLMIIRQEKDSIYIAADTLFSARLSDLHLQKDSLKADSSKEKKKMISDAKDSTDRYLEAYRHVRIFSDSLQAVSDSLFYSFKDSVFRLFNKPVIWSKDSQITGDTVYLFTKNKKPDHMQVFENSMIVNELERGIYNQVKSTRMDGYFIDGNIDSVRAKGFAECIYYIQDKDSAFVGANRSQSDIMDIYFANSQLNKVVLRSAVKGTLTPMKQVNLKEMRLQHFQWLEDRRPKTKFELFE